MGVMKSVFQAIWFVAGLGSGVALTVATILYMATVKNEQKPQELSDDDLKKRLCKPLNEESAQDGAADVAGLQRLVDLLNHVNSPMTQIYEHIRQVHSNGRENCSSPTIKSPTDSMHASRISEGIGDDDPRMATILDGAAISSIEKEILEALSELKDQGKQYKQIASFITDLGKAFASFSKDLLKLSVSAKSSMNKNMQLERKEDLILNNWWQVLHVSVEYLGFDQEEVAQFMTEEINSYAVQIQEGISIMEKKLSAEASKRFANMREHVSLFEAKKKERDKYREKMKNATDAATTAVSNQYDTEFARRASKMKTYEDLLVSQSKILFTAQKEFYGHVARMSSDIEVAGLKAIVEMQSLLGKLLEGFVKNHCNQRSTAERMKLQLANAAGSLVQILREEAAYGSEGKDLDAATESSFSRHKEGTLFDPRAERLREAFNSSGVQGYELNLQSILQHLINLASDDRISEDIGWHQQEGKAFPEATGAADATVSSPKNNGDSASSEMYRLAATAAGKLDMHSEATACLAASNPAILPHLPPVFFQKSIGVETCVWFNSFSGRLYRDIAHSRYFYRWFCAKLSQMLNRGPRPGYVDAFQVTDLQFGKLPPLLMNMKWSPRMSSDAAKSSTGLSSRKNAANKVAAVSDIGSEDQHQQAPPDVGEQMEFENEDDSDISYFAACTADMASRSGMTITISTKLWINWPRDRYASVPVVLKMNLAELSGKIRFGCTRSYSFLSFLEDPLMRMSVYNEVGKGMMKFKDMPQLSDFITRKLREFVHNKIVHPNSHKFRLVWPRNWWPEGTEDMFNPNPVNLDDGSNVGNGKDRNVKIKHRRSTSASVSDSGGGGSESEDTDISSRGGEVKSHKSKRPAGRIGKKFNIRGRKGKEKTVAPTAERFEDYTRPPVVSQQQTPQPSGKGIAEDTNLEQQQINSSGTNAGGTRVKLKSRVSSWLQKYAGGDGIGGKGADTSKGEKRNSSLHPELLAMREELKADNELWELTCTSIVTKHTEEKRHAASRKLLAAAGYFDRQSISESTDKDDNSSHVRQPLFPSEDPVESEVTSAMTIIVEDNYIDTEGNVDGASFRILNSSPAKKKEEVASTEASFISPSHNSSGVIKTTPEASNSIFKSDATGSIARSVQRNLNRGSTANRLMQEHLARQSVAVLTTLVQNTRFAATIGAGMGGDEGAIDGDEKQSMLGRVVRDAINRSRLGQHKIIRRHSDTTLVLMSKAFANDCSKAEAVASSIVSDRDGVRMSRAASISDFRHAVVEVMFQELVVVQARYADRRKVRASMHDSLTSRPPVSVGQGTGSKWFSDSTAMKFAQAKSKFKEFKAKHFAKDNTRNSLQIGDCRTIGDNNRSLVTADTAAHSDCDELYPSETSTATDGGATLEPTIESTPNSSRQSSLRYGEAASILQSLSSPEATNQQRHDENASPDVEGKGGKVSNLMRRLSSKPAAAGSRPTETEGTGGTSASSSVTGSAVKYMSSMFRSKPQQDANSSASVGSSGDAVAGSTRSTEDP